MNRFNPSLLLFLLLTVCALGQDKPAAEPAQLIKQRDDYLRARQRDSSAVVTKYLRGLEALKQQFGRESKLEAAVTVEQEIRKVTEENQRNTGSGAARSKRVVVKCYIEENFKGREYRIEGPAEYVTAAAAGIPNDKLASMKIPDGFKVTLFGNDAFRGNSESFTGEATDVGRMKGLTTSLIIAVADTAKAPIPAAGDPPELASRRTEYQTELKRAVAPALAAYRRNLQALKDQFTRESKFEAALAVDREMQKISQEAERP
jgi:hypothetical protein